MHKYNFPLNFSLLAGNECEDTEFDSCSSKSKNNCGKFKGMCMSYCGSRGAIERPKFKCPKKDQVCCA